MLLTFRYAIRAAFTLGKKTSDCFVVLFLLCLLPAPSEATQRVKIVTSIKPLALIAKDIGGNRVDVDVLVPVNRSPHDFALKVSDVMRVGSAQLLVWTDRELEPFMGKLLRGTIGSQPETLVVSEIPDIVDVSIDSISHDHHSGRDPHYWLNPVNALLIADRLSELLSQLDPEYQEEYQKAKRDFDFKISQYVEQVQAEFTAMTLKPVVVQHDAFRHFTGQFNLPQAGALRTGAGATVGARTLNSLMQKGAEAACLLVDPQYDLLSAEQFSQRTGLKMLVLDPLAGKLIIANDNYYRFLQSVVDTFKHCFTSEFD